MSIVQISKIQQRRGKANSNSGLPQLASGEFGWAIDTQQLFIGNGSVSEGAPAVGNTRLLSEYDLPALLDIISSGQYSYHLDDIDYQRVVTRTLQSRLDDQVSTASFGTVGDGTTDESVNLQTAINQIYLNESKAPSYDVNGVPNRITINIPAGTFKITSTLLIPSYATIVGAGVDKTIISYSGTGPAIQFIHDGYTDQSSVYNTSANTRPKFITLRELTVHTDTADQVCLQLNSITHCLIENVNITGAWGTIYHSASRGINLTAISTLVTCELNTFNNINVSGFSHGVYTDHDVKANVFSSGYITDVRQGFALGVATDGLSYGQSVGPVNTTIANYKFYDVHRHGVYIGTGTDNIVDNCTFELVGNNNGGISTNAEYPNIYFNTIGNTSVNNTFDRSTVLQNPSVDIPYVPEVAGYITYASRGSYAVAMTATSGNLFRLPVSTDASGIPAGSITIEVNYVYKSISHSINRSGTLSMSVDVNSGLLQYNDEFDILSVSSADSLAVFTVVLLDSIGVPYEWSSVTSPYSILVSYTAATQHADGVLNYSYTASF